MKRTSLFSKFKRGFRKLVRKIIPRKTKRIAQRKKVSRKRFSLPGIFDEAYQKAVETYQKAVEVVTKKTAKGKQTIPKKDRIYLKDFYNKKNKAILKRIKIDLEKALSALDANSALDKQAYAEVEYKLNKVKDLEKQLAHKRFISKSQTFNKLDTSIFEIQEGETVVQAYLRQAQNLVETLSKEAVLALGPTWQEIEDYNEAKRMGNEPEIKRQGDVIGKKNTATSIAKKKIQRAFNYSSPLLATKKTMENEFKNKGLNLRAEIFLKKKRALPSDLDGKIKTYSSLLASGEITKIEKLNLQAWDLPSSISNKKLMDRVSFNYKIINQAKLKYAKSKIKNAVALENIQTLENNTNTIVKLIYQEHPKYRKGLEEVVKKFYKK